jgi:feruloyl esterase
VRIPVLNFVDTMIWNLWNVRALAAAALSLEKLRLVGDAVYRRCDALDGSADGLIDDPCRCDFDPARDLPLCAARQERPDCFTPGQVRALKAIYGGVVSGGKPYFPGQPVGAEKVGKPFVGSAPPSSGWDQWLIAEAGKSRQLLYGESFVRHMGFRKADPSYDWRTFDFDRDPARMDAIRGILDARNVDLSEFSARAGASSSCTSAGSTPR